MNNEKPGSPSWLWPAVVAIAIIAGFSLLLPSHSTKQANPQASTPSGLEASPPAEHPTGLDLAGVVKDGAGQPVTNASIFIYTAQPRSGPGFT